MKPNIALSWKMKTLKCHQMSLSEKMKQWLSVLAYFGDIQSKEFDLKNRGYTKAQCITVAAVIEL